MSELVSIEVEYGNLVREGKKIRDRGRKKEEGLVLDHFDLGCLIKDLVGKAKYGEGAVERYAKEIDVKEPTLRIDYGVAKHFRFRRELIEKKVAELKDAGKAITWGYFRALVNPDSNPEVHGSPEKHKQHLLGKAETAASALTEAAEHYPNDEQVAGTALGVQEAIQEAEFVILGDHGKSGFIKNKDARWTCDPYRAFIKAQPCIICGNTHGVEPHHLIYTSRGKQGSDITCAPFCRKHHDEYHAIGRVKFEEKYNIDFNPIVIYYIQKFITEILK